jgi:transketolase
MKENIKHQKIIKDIRLQVLDMCYHTGNGHIASSFSIVEIIYSLYEYYRGNEAEFDFILSKGHGAPCLYSLLHEFGKISKRELKGFCRYGSKLTSHASAHVPGVAVSSGALGLGLSVGIGFCLANKIEKNKKKVYVLVGDGELNEGSVWESLLYAGSSGLDNIICLVDCNKLQASNHTDQIINSKVIFSAIRSMKWKMIRVDGHNLEEIARALSITRKMKGPIMIVFDTVKGKGVSFMENNPFWHHEIPNKEEYLKARLELSYED